MTEKDGKEKDDITTKKFTNKFKLAPISSICSMLLGGIIALVSTLSFIIDMLSTRNLVALSIDVLVMTISYLTIWQGIYYTIIDRMVKAKAEEDWNYRITPILKLLTETAGRINIIEEEIVHTNLKVSTTLDYIMKSQDMDASKIYIIPGLSFKFISKILVLIFFTFSSLVYISSYPLGIVHYFILLVYLTWWVFITAEYKLFGNMTAWVWAIAPIMIIPTVGIIMSAVYGINIMIGIFFLFMLIYVYSYYSWACYMATGYKILDLKPIIHMFRDKLKRLKLKSKKNGYGDIDDEELRRLVK